jgi:hypothetical protein
LNLTGRAFQLKMQVPAQNGWFVIARIKNGPLDSADICRCRSTSFGKVAAWATQCEISQQRFSAARDWNDVLI